MNDDVTSSSSSASTPDAAPRVEIYSSEWCPFCRTAARLLERRGVEFTVHGVDGRPEVRAEMERRSGRRTVPQIFIGGRHVGGCDDLLELDADGELEPLLHGPGA